eukprot:TRINITY_DN121651_c0_g1_i1.p1 TRINITY_DN121651_c0_g1~~TRINITY_DN121651_c0_g1_i1.p1  ORF type:complete len:958 (-),score=133.84 TRINITY_DN121651_c0_g1_i1:8-2881(-)
MQLQRYDYEPLTLTGQNGAVPSDTPRTLVMAPGPHNPASTSRTTSREPMLSGRNLSRPPPVDTTRQISGASNPSLNCNTQLGSGSDFVQFACLDFYVDRQMEDFVEIMVFRVGDLHGIATVRYDTEPWTAKEHVDFAPQMGTLRFEEGEFLKRLVVPIKHHGHWEPTMELKMKLSNPRGCFVSQQLGTCYVKVVDSMFFPAEEMRQYKDATLKYKALPVFGSFFTYFWLNYECADVRQSSWITVCFDQLGNLYLVLKIWVSMYLVNVVCNEADIDTERMLLMPTRGQTAWLLAGFTVVPMFLLHIWEWFKLRMDVHGKTAFYLRSRLFRIYLGYNDEARDEVCSAMMQLAVSDDTEALADGYCAALSMVRSMGNLIIQIIFMGCKNADNLSWLLALTVVMFVVGYVAESRAWTVAGTSAQKADLLEFLDEATEDIECTIDYGKRAFIGEIMEQKAMTLMQAARPSRLIRMHSKEVLGMGGPIFCALYMGCDVPRVLDHKIGLGTFLATLSILSNVAEDIKHCFDSFSNIALCIKPMRRLVKYFNMPTDCKELQERVAKDFAYGQRLEKQISVNPGMWGVKKTGKQHGASLDMLPIMLRAVTLRSYDQGTIIKDLSLKVQQGEAVAILGHHMSGRASIMRLIGQKQIPTEGDVFVPTHLRVVHVSMDPVMLTLTPFDDLTFGILQRKDIDRRRISWILARLGLDKMLALCKDELVVTDEGFPTEGTDREKKKDTDTAWQKQLTSTEQSLLHIARALIANPEVLVMQRPLHRFSGEMSQRVRDMLLAHVADRGLHLPPGERDKRRPRTLVYSCDSREECKAADIVYKMCQLGPNSPYPCRLEDVTRDYLPRGTADRPVNRRSTAELEYAPSIRSSSRPLALPDVARSPDNAVAERAARELQNSTPEQRQNGQMPASESAEIRAHRPWANQHDRYRRVDNEVNQGAMSPSLLQLKNRGDV